MGHKCAINGGNKEDNPFHGRRNFLPGSASYCSTFRVQPALGPSCTHSFLHQSEEHNALVQTRHRRWAFPSALSHPTLSWLQLVLSWVFILQSMVCTLREQANIAVVVECVGLSRFSTWCYRTVKLKRIKWLRCHKPGLEAVQFSLAGCSLPLCDCAWQSHGRNGLLLPCKHARPLNLSAQGAPRSRSCLCVCVWTRRCARVVEGFPL